MSRSLLRHFGIASALAAVLALTAGPALAYFVTSGSGSGSAKVASLSAPSLTKADASGTSVELGWSAVSAPGSGSVDYYVTREGGAPAGNCPTSSSPSTVTSCTDTGLSPGVHSYTVTAVWRSWSAKSGVREVTIAKKTQTIEFTSTAPAKALVGEASYEVTAEATSHLAVTLESRSTSICTLSSSGSGATVTTKAAGTCVIDAKQSGNSEYEAAPLETQQFAVRKTQTIKFTSTAPTKASVGGATYTVTATGGASGQPVTLSIAASAKSICSLSGSSSGSSVSFTGVGNCVIDANQAGDSEYEAATQETQTFSVGKGAQTIKFTSTAPTKASVGGATYTVTATGGASGQPVTLSIAASAKSICSLSGSSSGSSVSFTGVGNCVIDANQAGDSEYDAAVQETQTFSVGKGAQTIKFTSTAPTKASVGGATYTVTATGGASGQPVTLSIAASAKSICSLSGSSSGSSVSLTGVGNCVIDANQAGDSEYEAATQETQTFSVGKRTQTITFANPISKAVLGEDSYQATVTASSKLPVTLTSENKSVCTLSGSSSGATVDMKAIGTCVIIAKQAGTTEWEAAQEELEIVISISKKTQTITFSAPPSKATVGEYTYKVTATATSKLAVTLTSENTSVCTLSDSSSGATVDMKATGTCVIVGEQAGTTEWEAVQEELEFTVGSKR